MSPNQFRHLSACIRLLCQFGNCLEFQHHERKPLAEIIVNLLRKASALLLLSVDQTHAKSQTFLLGLFAFGDVKDHSDHVMRFSGLSVVAASTGRDPANTAV